MSVKVEYAPQPAPPITEIALRDAAGYALVLVPGKTEVRLRAHVRRSGPDDFAVINPSDARDLAAALVEWADSVGPEA